MNSSWPNGMNIAQIRIARPTHQLEKVVQFYCEGLGLKEVGFFNGHEGYDGVMIGLPDSSYHLEFTQYRNPIPCPPPSKDNLLVFYMMDKETIQEIESRLNSMGYHAVAPENPFWQEKGVTIEDPDGWRIVLMNTNGI